MNILHISDLHFGPRHWEGNNKLLLEKLNSYNADIVINTGDSTTDSLECEFRSASNFLNSINCTRRFSIIGNHDKRNLRSQDLFHEFIDDAIIYPLDPQKCTKKNIFLDPSISKVNNHFTDINFIHTLTLNGETTLIVGIDTNEMYSDNGCIDDEMLRTLSEHINQATYDKIFLMCHHSPLETDNDPLYNSYRLQSFISKHEIEHVFCGHTHKLSLKTSTDHYQQHSFTQYVSGSLSAANHSEDTNMFLFYENWAEEGMKIHLVRIFVEGEQLIFKEELITF
ncbi:metallophosphoesterase family protein [Psychromonas hadalis]|uniref:metallophosphoesterase family protein n=1 Tax=Psychromonas hadalis TaxID=211669 RepID=UPI0003B6FEE5|nr:metallophosphoesterase [Psychromonas hadalis]